MGELALLVYTIIGFSVMLYSIPRVIVSKQIPSPPGKALAMLTLFITWPLVLYERFR